MSPEYKGLKNRLDWVYIGLWWHLILVTSLIGYRILLAEQRLQEVIRQERQVLRGIIRTEIRSALLDMKTGSATKPSEPLSSSD